MLCGVSGETREKRLSQAPALEQMVWWKPSGLRWASEDMGGSAGGMGTGRRLELCVLREKETWAL